MTDHLLGYFILFPSLSLTLFSCCPLLHHVSWSMPPGLGNTICTSIDSFSSSIFLLTMFFHVSCIIFGYHYILVAWFLVVLYVDLHPCIAYFCSACFFSVTCHFYHLFLELLCQVLLPSTSSICVARASVTAISHYFTHFLVLEFFPPTWMSSSTFCHFSFPWSKTIFRQYTRLSPLAWVLTSQSIITHYYYYYIDN